MPVVGESGASAKRPKRRKVKVKAKAKAKGPSTEDMLAALGAHDAEGAPELEVDLEDDDDSEPGAEASDRLIRTLTALSKEPTESVETKRREAMPENEFHVPPVGEVSIEDLMAPLRDEARFSREVKELKALAQREGLPEPAPEAARSREERSLQYQRTSKDAQKWFPQIHRMNRADQVVLDSQPVVLQSTTEIVGNFAPVDDFEKELEAVTRAAGAGEEDLRGAKVLPMNPRIREEQQTRQVARLKALMLREQQTKRRVNKIKSKTYRRIHRKSEAKDREVLLQRLELENPELAQQLKQDYEKKHAERRLLRQRNARKKWASTMQRFAKGDRNAQQEISKQAQKAHDEEQALRRAIAGKDAKDSDSEHVDLSDDEEGDGQQTVAKSTINKAKRLTVEEIRSGDPEIECATGGCIALAVCAYFFGYYVLRSQSSPYRLQLRVFLVAGMLVCTCVVTASAWLFLGGLDSCRAFDTSMMNSQGYTFDHLWAMLCVRYGVNWCLTLIGIFLLLADHPPSTYIRHCIRCCLCLYMSQVVITLGMTWNACTGADVNEDGVRDSILEGSANLQESLAAGMEVSGTLLFFLSGNWFLQIVVKMMRALEAAFGEPLPRFTTIVYLNHFVVAMTIVSAAILRLPLLFLQAGVIVALALIALTALEFLALGVPLRALQGAMCDDDTGAPLEKLKIAKSTLRRFQAAIVLRNLTTVFFLCILAFANGLILNPTLYTLGSYSSLLSAVGNALGLALLTSGSLNIPRSAPKAIASSPGLRDERAQAHLVCTCGRVGKRRGSLREEEEAGPGADPVGQTLSQFSGGRHWIATLGSDTANPACDRCAWDEKVRAIASRRMSVNQLLDFYTQLAGRNQRQRLMPHYDPARSTTHEVVRQAVIPQSRCGDRGKALAEVLASSESRCLPSSSATVRMVTHHWANRFRDLLAAVVADSLGLKRWDSIAEELSSSRQEALKARLHSQGSLHWEYWICAFCINQHASICDVVTGARDTVTGELLPSCDCATPKHLNDSPIQCELNKFDNMMAHLYHCYNHRFLQVVATDKKFDLFSRAWCIAELVQANASRMEQHVILHSYKVLEENSAQLESLRVEDCSASRPEDKAGILNKIGSSSDIADFNRRLQQLLLGSDGLFAGCKDAQALLHDVGAMAARAKASKGSHGDLEEDLVEI
ncbi:unnamed protein product [Symbiodinium natans]|uniref:Uncharacterized protein n=1 Tax=Symbiodinium natans TaxID=878477 RepID=A0A812HZ36_9DINO|nr:unnamed protein product [Symbiodinium natans]